jgi:dihydroorotase
MIVIRNAMVLTPSGIEQATVVVDGDTVHTVGVEPEANGHHVIDAGGAWLGPGLVDLHVHFRDPGQTWKEDVVSGAAAAAAGGFTAVVAMPNTEPPVDNRTSAMTAAERAAGVADVEIVAAGSLTKGRSGEELADFDGMYEAGIRVFSDDGDSVPTAGLLRRAMEYLHDLPGILVAEHAEDRSVAGDGHMHEGAVSTRLGIAGLPAIAEELVVARDLVLAATTGVRLHVQHVSTAGSVDLIGRARDEGIEVTSEVTPHHLALDDRSVEGLDSNFKMYPPLRDREDRDALVQALRDGIIDAVATDHAPHTVAEKGVPFEEAPRGVIGLETAAAVVTTHALGDDQRLFFERMSVAPARIAGLDRHGRHVETGSPANLVLFDPAHRWVPRSFASRSSNSPFSGTELTGRVLATIREGKIVYEAGAR